ncbi:hypothetical protein [Rhodococcus sp. EPR-157]|nr:hypothetical protein [Rhodococcus sp. EPR-157]
MRFGIQTLATAVVLGVVAGVTAATNYLLRTELPSEVQLMEEKS